MKKYLYISLIAIFMGVGSLSAQDTYRLNDQQQHVVWGQGYKMNLLQRFPSSAQGIVPDDVWIMSLGATGCQIRFKTNSLYVNVTFTRNGSEASVINWASKMSANGMDLYKKDEDGKWCYHYPAAYNFASNFNFSISPIDSGAYRDNGSEYILYLPSIAKLSDLAITVEPGAKFEFMPTPATKPIVTYGTSIIHGIAASRPANCWTNILSRKMIETQIVNLGFSSRGRVEPEVIDVINQIDAEVYVVDCLPNMTNASERAQIETRYWYAIQQIKKRHPDAAIVLTEHLGFADIDVNEIKQDLVNGVNDRLKEIYKVAAKSFTNIHYLSRADLGLDMPRDMADHIHPNDRGMHKYAIAYYNKIMEIRHGASYEESHTKARIGGVKGSYNVGESVEFYAKDINGDIISANWLLDGELINTNRVVPEAGNHKLTLDYENEDGFSERIIKFFSVQ